MFKPNLLSTISIYAISTGLPVAAFAQEAIDEVVVTARKKAESLQDVPIAVSALDEKLLDELGIDVFSDYLLQMPGITAGGSGPGQNTIYIRGVASTTPNLTTAGVAGLAPNVALYLDEQPLTQPGRNLDVYAVDMERVEVLSGPQGTLFGASSQAGVVRLITNKPEIGEYSNFGRFEASYTPEGDPSHKFELVSNIPVNEKLAIRTVLYQDQQGGYIDNVLSTDEVSVADAARFRTAGTVRANGAPVLDKRKGFQAGADLSGVTFVNADNTDLVDDDINDTRYRGIRASAKYEADNGVTFLASITDQELEADGVFFDDPNKGEYKISRFQRDEMTDEFTNINWTVTGDIGALTALYTGAFTERETDQVVDYTDYVFVSQYLPHYVCDTTVSYPSAVLTGDTKASGGSTGTPTGACSTPESKADSFTELTNESHEIRFSGFVTEAIDATFGAFWSEIELKERNDYIYLGSIGRMGDIYPVITPGISTTEKYSAGTVWRNDITRTDEQLGVFGEVTFDVVPDLWSVTLGTRYYDVEVDLIGMARGGGFGAKDNNGDGIFPTADTDPANNNLTTLFSASGAGIDKAAADGWIPKVSVSHTPTENKLYYATYSEGFRPGILNRPGGRLATDGSGYVVPFEVATDDLKNYELGWKITSDDRRMRFNGSVFMAEIEKMQTTIFDPNIANLFFSENAVDAEVYGLEGDITYLPASIEGLSLTGAFSFLDTEVTEVLVETEDVENGVSLAFAPEVQFNLRARYEWEIGNGMQAHFMPSVVYSDKQYSDIITINRDEIDSYTLVNLSAGITNDIWSGEFFIDNATDEHAETARNFVNDVERVTPARPMTFGLRFARNF